MVNQYHIHFTTQNYAGNVGLTTGDNLIQTHTIGNTEEKHETNTKTNTTANYRLKKNKERIRRRNNENRNGGKRMNKYQKWLISHMVNVSYATRKLG